MAVMFLSIGALSVFGTGLTLSGNSVEFSTQLLNIFSSSLGTWSYWAFGIAAFITIYGTLIVVVDAFARSLLECLEVLTFSSNQKRKRNLNSERNLNLVICIISLGSFFLFYYFASSMISMLEFATTLAFICAPFIAFLNFKCIMSPSLSKELKLPQWLKVLAFIGLIFLIFFAIYYLANLFI